MADSQSLNGCRYPVENFQENGFASCPIISTEEARNALDQIEEYWKASSSPGNLSIRGNDRFKIHLFLSRVNQIVHHPALLQAVRQALQTPHIALWSSDLNIKKPNSRQYFSAHQDATYTGLQLADQCVTVWLALSDPVGLQEGCLSFLKGSHKHGQLPHVEELATTTTATTSEENTNMLSRGQRVLYKANDYSPEDWVAIPLRAGEATLHHFHTIHQSGHDQHPTQSRVGLALRYMSQSVRQTGPIREYITWIDSDSDTTSTAANKEEENDKRRRKALEQFFDLEPRLSANPTPEEVEAGRQAHEEAMRREASNYFLDSDKVKAYEK